MKRAIIAALATIGLSSIAGISFAETELSEAKLDNVTAAGGRTTYSKPSSFTFQNQKTYQSNYCAGSQCSNQSQQNQTGTQSGLVNVGGVNAGNVAVQTGINLAK